MSLLSIAQARYSCRNYLPRHIEQDKLDYIFSCVRLAPSAVNRQPWHFHIVSSEAMRRKVQSCYDRPWFATAPMYIVATILHDQEWVRADGKRHGDIDIAIATEHLCLAATEQGLATCWVCNFDAERLASLLHLTADEVPAVIIPIGYAADTPREKSRKALAEILCSEQIN